MSPRILPLPVAVPLSLPVLPLSPQKTNVISTEGGALCRRSEEIPVFLFLLSLHTTPETCQAQNHQKPAPIQRNRMSYELHPNR
jgi:hypothetical protein